jgi:hypothetical protein
MNDIQSLPQALIDTAAKIVSEGSEYHDFFAKAMKKFGITSPSELKGDKEKEFYDYIDKNWKGKGEKKEEKIIRIMSEVGGKYLKYSDLLLQKSRLVDKHGPSSSQVKKVNGLLGKEMKKLGIEETDTLNYESLYLGEKDMYMGIYYGKNPDKLVKVLSKVKITGLSSVMDDGSFEFEGKPKDANKISKLLHSKGIEPQYMFDHVVKEEVITEKAMSLKQIAKKYKKDLAKLKGQFPKDRSPLNRALLAHAYEHGLIKTDNPDHADKVIDGLLDDLDSLI